MNRFRTSNPQDDAMRSDGDQGFMGINMKLDPDKLPPGVARRAVNKVMRRGVAATRNGICTPVSHNPRLLRREVAPCDVLVVRFDWDASNGQRLASRLQLAGDAASLIGTRLGAVQYPPAGSPFYYAMTSELTTVDVASPDYGHHTYAINVQALNDEFGGVIELDFGLFWAKASASAGGDARVRVTFTPYKGGDVDISGPDPVGTGAAGAPRAVELQLYTDNFGSDDAPSLGDSPLKLFVADDEDGDNRVIMYAPPELPLPGTIGTPGYVSAAPATIAESILGAGRYSDSAGFEWMLLATPQGVWRVADGRTPLLIPIPEPIAYAVEFVQFAESVLMFRGTARLPWLWAGNPAVPWAPQSQIDPGNNTKPLPGAETAEALDTNRLLIPVGRDQVAITDVLSLYYDPLLSVFNLRKGTDDSIVRVFPFVNGQALVFKSRSVSLLAGLNGDLSGIALEDVNRQIGLAARKAVTMVGADVWFLSSTGVFKVSQVIQDRIQTEPIPVSDPIEPFFRTRVNWPTAAGAVSAVLGEYYYLALPIDGAAGNNALLCFNTATQMWEGWHTFPEGVQLTDLVAAQWSGQRRLYAADRDKGFVYLLHEGAVDRIGTVEHPIADLLETRGYLVETEELKDFSRAEVQMETWNPTYSVFANFDGVHERRQTVAARTRSRTAYYRHGVPDYDPSNANDDHATPKRQDYSVSLATPFQPRSGIALELTQIAPERFALRQRARWMTLEIQGSQGRCNVLSTSVEARQSDRSNTRRA